MVSRRLIRIKVVQILYAAVSSAKSADLAMRELSYALGKTYELYHHFLCFPIAAVDCVMQQIALGRQKFSPTPEEVNPNTKFADNSFAGLLRSHEQLAAHRRTTKFEWQPQVVKSILRSFREDEQYHKYMENAVRSFADDKAIMLHLMETQLEDREELYSFLEEQSIYWADDVEYALSHAIKSCRMLSPTNMGVVLPLYKSEDEQQFAHVLMLQSLSRMGEYRRIIEKHSEHWELERIAVIDTVIMLAAIAELLNFASIPVSVTLNEYIEIAKHYSTHQSGTFINGMLDKIVLTLQNMGLLQKYGIVM